MPEIIEATFPPDREPTFATPSEAIAFSKSIHRARGGERWSSCIGRVIGAVDWAADCVALHLDNLKVLHVGSAENRVVLKIEDDLASNVPSAPHPPGAVLLRLSGKDILWKRAELMQALRGNAIRRIQMSQTGLFLYVANVGIVAVNVLIDRKLNRPFFFWDLTD
jgi:hypothetical protein